MEEYTNEYDLLSEEDIAKIVSSENSNWTKMTLEEILAFHDSISQNTLKDDADMYHEEDLAKVLDAIIKDEWVNRTPEEMIEHIQNLFKNTSGENDEIK